MVLNWEPPREQTAPEHLAFGREEGYDKALSALERTAKGIFLRPGGERQLPGNNTMKMVRDSEPAGQRVREMPKLGKHSPILEEESPLAL